MMKVGGFSVGFHCDLMQPFGLHAALPCAWPCTQPEGMGCRKVGLCRLGDDALKLLRLNFNTGNNKKEGCVGATMKD